MTPTPPDAVRPSRSLLLTALLLTLTIAATGCVGPPSVACPWDQVGEGGNLAVRLLRTLATDVTASQSLLADPADRRALLSADWADGSAAAAVVATATAPDHPDPARAQRSAENARDLFTDLGTAPAAWRELIPSGSAVSRAISRLAAHRVGAFVTGPAGLRRSATGRWIADPDLRDVGPGVLAFLAHSGPGEPKAGTVELLEVRSAAWVHSVLDTVAALRDGPTAARDVVDTLSGAGRLRSLVDRAQHAVLLGRGASPDEADGVVARDTRSGLWAGRSVFQALPRSYDRDLTAAAHVLDMAFDALPSSIDPELADFDLIDIPRNVSESRSVDDDYLLATAVVTADPEAATSPLVTADGDLLSYSDVARNVDRVSDLAALARRPAQENTDWDRATRSLRDLSAVWFGSGDRPNRRETQDSFDVDTIRAIRCGT